MASYREVEAVSEPAGDIPMYHEKRSNFAPVVPEYAAADIPMDGLEEDIPSGVAATAA